LSSHYDVTLRLSIGKRIVDQKLISGLTMVEAMDLAIADLGLWRLAQILDQVLGQETQTFDDVTLVVLQ